MRQACIIGNKFDLSLLFMFNTSKQVESLIQEGFSIRMPD